MYLLKFVTLKVNEKSAENSDKIERMLTSFLGQILRGWDAGAGGNFWNFEFASHQFQNALGFLEQEALPVKHAGVVLLSCLLEVGGRGAVKRFVKNGVVDLLEGVLAQLSNSLSELKSIQGAEKKLKLGGNLRTEEHRLNLADKKRVMEGIESQTGLTQDAIKLLIAIFHLTCLAEEGVSIDRLTAALEPFFSHPLAEVHALLLPAFKSAQEDHPELLEQNDDAFARVLVYNFSVLKRRNFAAENYGFLEFFEGIIDTATRCHPESLESVFKVFAKVTANATVS